MDGLGHQHYLKLIIYTETMQHTVLLYIMVVGLYSNKQNVSSPLTRKDLN